MPADRASGVERLESVAFGIAALRRCDERPSACPFRQAREADAGDDVTRLRCLDIGGRDAIAERLHACLGHADDMNALRRIAARDNPSSLQMEDRDVIELVAALVARQALCALGAMITQPASFAGREEGSSQRYTGTKAQPAPPPRPPDPAPPRTRPRPPAEAPAPEAGDMAEGVDPARQATVLKDASRDGVPFCAVCEKARQERERQHQAEHEHAQSEPA